MITHEQVQAALDREEGGLSLEHFALEGDTEVWVEALRPACGRGCCPDDLRYFTISRADCDRPLKLPRRRNGEGRS